MPETILDLTTRVQLEPLKAGLADAVRTVNSSAASIGSSFSNLASSTDGSMARIEAEIASLRGEFGSLSVTVTEAMSQVSKSIVVGSEEGGAALANLRRELGEVAASAELSASGAISAFGPLGAIFGVGLAASYAEKLKEVVLQIGRLSDLTGISVPRLTEFRAALEELGVPSENLPRLLVHLATQMSAVADGSKTAKESFDQLGVSTDGWSKKLPDALDVLLQMSDHLHKFKGNSDDAAAAAHVLGQRLGVELAGGLSVGSAAIKERMEKHKDLGAAMQKSIDDARRLQEAEAEASERIQEAALPLLGFLADFLNTSHLLWTALASDVAVIAATINAALYSIGTSLEGTLVVLGKVAVFDFSGARASMQSYANDIADAWHQVGQRITSENAAIQKAIEDVVRPPAHMPAGKESPGGTHEAKTSVSSVLAQWREEIQQKIEAEAAGDEEAKSLEIAFWQAKLETQKNGSALYLAVMRELTRAKRELAKEEYADMVARDRDLASLAASGSAERVRLEQKTLADISAVHAAGTREYEEQLKRVTVAMQQMDEQNVRDEVTAVGEQVEAAKRGSSERVDLLGAEIAKLQGIRQAALANAETAELTAQVRSTQAASEADRYRAESFRTYAMFVEKEISETQRKFIEAQRQMTEAAQKLKTESINQDVKQRITTVQEGPGGIKDTGAEFELQKQHITELAQLDLISKSQAIEMVRQIETTQHVADSEKLQAEREYIALQMQSLAAAGGDITKLQEEYNRVLKQIADEKRRFDLQMAQDDQKMWLQMEQNAQKASQIISNAFTSAFDKMLTTHTNFGKVMESFWNQMVLGFEKMGLQILAKLIQQIAMRVLAEAAGQSAQTAAAAGGAAARQQIDIIANLKSILSSAGKAAAKVYAEYAEVPPLAAAMAAAAFAITVAFGSMGSAEGGAGTIPKTMFILAHANEMIFPAPLAGGLRTLLQAPNQLTAAMGAMGNPSALLNRSFAGIHATPAFAGAGGPGGIGGPGGAGGPGGGGGSHVTNNHFEISLHAGGSGEELRAVLDDELVPRIQRAIRNGALDR